MNRHGPTTETARAIALLCVSAREIRDAGANLAAPYRKRLRLMAQLADAVSKQIYEDINDYQESHRKGR